MYFAENKEENCKKAAWNGDELFSANKEPAPTEPL